MSDIKNIRQFLDVIMRNLGSISSMFYAQLLRAQIPKAKKDSQFVSLFTLSGSERS
jgi:hypothetical protein